MRKAKRKKYIFTVQKKRMKHLTEILLITMMTIGVSGCGTDTSELTLLVGTYTNTGSEGIYSYRFNQNTGKYSSLSVTKIDNPSFLTITPDNKKVYAVTEQMTDAAVSVFTIDITSGKMNLTGSQPTNGQDPCHVTFIGKEVTATNYSSGSLSIFPLNEDGSLRECKLVEFFESGPDTLRQKTSHIHSSQLSPDGAYLFVMDLGGDYIYRYPVKAGKIADHTPVRIKAPSGCGPRHFTFSKDGRFMYVLTELGGTIVVYSYSQGDLTLIQEIKADSCDARGSADIHFSPDGKFLYSSHRLKNDGIAIFSQDSGTGLLTSVGYQPTGSHPRNFAISPNGRYLLVACRDSDLIQIFERDRTTGLLTDTHNDINTPCPVCVIPVL